MIIDVRAFRGGAWCGNGYGLDNWGPHYLWQSVWTTEIPYIVTPMSVSCYTTKWLDLWGISSPGQSFDFINEVMGNGPADQQMWDARYGANDWDEMAKHKCPFVFVRYGAFAYNVIRQHWRIANHVQIAFTGLSTNSALRVHSTDTEWQQPRFVDNIYLIIPGTMVSYDWVRMRVLVPKILRASFAAAVWQNLACNPKQTSIIAGILKQGSGANTRVDTSNNALSGLIKGIDPAAEADADREEEAEQAAKN